MWDPYREETEINHGKLLRHDIEILEQKRDAVQLRKHIFFKFLNKK